MELQIGRRLFFQDLGTHPHHGCDVETSSDLSYTQCASDSSDDEDIPYNASYDKMETCGSSSKGGIMPLPKETIELLMDGEFILPCSEEFSLPSVVACSRGCKETYYCRYGNLTVTFFFLFINLIP